VDETASNLSPPVALTRSNNVKNRRRGHSSPQSEPNDVSPSLIAPPDSGIGGEEDMFIETVTDVFQHVKGSCPEVGVFRCCLVIPLLMPVRTATAQTAAQFETPPTLPAQELAPASLLNGNGFHVDQAVPTDGLTAHFTLRSDVGTFNADGLEMLRIRVAEIPAIVELNQTSKSKVFAQALATNAAAPVAAAGQMVMHPVDTVKGLPAGVGRFFGRVGLGAQKIKEAATTPEEASAGEKAGEVATRTFHTTRDVLGYEQERRGLAKKLHVDPYATNPILSKQLDDFAVVAFRAHIGVTTAMSVFIPGSMANHRHQGCLHLGVRHAEGGSHRAKPEKAAGDECAGRKYSCVHEQ